METAHAGKIKAELIRALAFLSLSQFRTRHPIPLHSTSFLQYSPRQFTPPRHCFMGSPTHYSIQDERRLILDELEDLPLKGFQEIDNTPTTFVTSLPTPKAGPYYSEVVDGLNGVIPSTESLVRIMGDEAPGAPRWKDFDSFTEGTGKGSFDSIPAASTNEYGEPIPRVNTLFLSLLPPHDTRLSIEIWREEVFSHSPTAAELATCPPVEENYAYDSYDSSSPHKRPRSLAPDDDDRRIRRRAQSDISLTSSSPVFLMDGRQHLPLVDTPHDNRHQLRRSHSVPPD